MKILRLTAILGLAVSFICFFSTSSLGFRPQPEPPGAEQVQPPTNKPPVSDVEQTGLGPEGLTEKNPDNINIKPRMSVPITDTKPLNIQGGPTTQHPPEPGILIKTNPDDIKLKPSLQGHYSDTNQPLNIQGSPKMQESLDEQHPPEPGKPKMMQQTMPGLGSEKMDDDEEAPPLQQRSPAMMQQTMPGPGSEKMDEEEEEQHGMPQGIKMMDQGEAGGPGGPKMMDQGEAGGPGGPKMIDPVDDGIQAVPGSVKMEDPGEGPTPGMKSQKRMNRKIRRY